MKLDSIKRADIAIMRATGHSTTEIAEKLNISPQLVSYYLNQFKKKAKKTNPQWTFLEIILQAGPAYPIFSMLNKIRKIKSEKK